MRYHKDIGFPKTITFPVRLNHLIWSKHASYKGYGLNLQTFPNRILNLKKESIIEIKTDDDIHINGIVIRRSYNRNKDLILVLKINKKTILIKTVWFNYKKDKHQTLNKSLYNIPKN